VRTDDVIACWGNNDRVTDYGQTVVPAGKFRSGDRRFVSHLRNSHRRRRRLLGQERRRPSLKIYRFFNEYDAAGVSSIVAASTRPPAVVRENSLSSESRLREVVSTHGRY
jgi:hypothetical protein